MPRPSHPPADHLSPTGHVYVWCVVAAGGLAIAHSVYTLSVAPVPWHWLILAALTLLSATFTIKLPAVSARLSVSETFIFTSVFLFGTAPGTLIDALDGFVFSLWRKERKLHRILFNVAEPALSVWLASQLFYYLAGVKPLHLEPADFTGLLFPLLALTCAYFLCNSSFISIAVALEKGANPLRIWRQHFRWLSLNYFGGVSIAALLVQNRDVLRPSMIGVAVPLLIISYLVFKHSLARVEEADRHVQEVNTLYLSTIETLAMAVDAKDQVTHGHIRRVQAYATALTRALRVEDESLLKAVEAAALLHDMGKLAVPDHILNKPGKLSPAEFDLMKLHADAGAEILSAIAFPYPVVPIVRHHHENWDGSGYPDGLAGADIPLGARILSVVDCFDALTSDRPYRPRLSEAEALAILKDRRGKMYDPVVVDTFIRIHPQVALPDVEPGPPRLTLAKIVRSSQRLSAMHAPARQPAERPRSAGQPAAVS